MAGKPEVDAVLDELEAANNARKLAQTEVVSLVLTLLTDFTATISRALALIAAGSPDLQAEVDRLKAIKDSISADAQVLVDTKPQIESADAQAKSEFIS